MSPRPVWPAMIAVGSTVAAAVLGELNRSGAERAGVRIELDRQAYVVGAARPGEARRMQFRWSVPEAAPFLADERLAELGFAAHRTSAALPRLVWVTLERDSVLTVVDAGVDRAALRERSPDAERRLVYRAVVGAWVSTPNQRTPGYLQSFVPKVVRIPAEVTGSAVVVRAGRFGWPVVSAVP